jgi:hypothetical protein
VSNPTVGTPRLDRRFDFYVAHHSSLRSEQFRHEVIRRTPYSARLRARFLLGSPLIPEDDSRAPDAGVAARYTDPVRGAPLPRPRAGWQLPRQPARRPCTSARAQPAATVGLGATRRADDSRPPLVCVYRRSWRKRNLESRCRPRSRSARMSSPQRSRSRSLLPVHSEYESLSARRRETGWRGDAHLADQSLCDHRCDGESVRGQ